MLVFDLVQALNTVGTGGQAVFGQFSVGTYNSGEFNFGSFQTFDQYYYSNGVPHIPGDPYDTTRELVWTRSGFDVYPHLGIENINGNAEITSNLWNESVYWHPGPGNVYASWETSAARPCVIRFTVPANASALNMSGNILKGAWGGTKAGFTILKNGVPIFTRVVMNSGDVVPVNLMGSALAGDIIDFVLDVDTEGSSQDDSAITLSISLQLETTPTPVVTGSVNCTDTSVSGTIPLLQTGTVTLRDSLNNIVGTGSIVPIAGTVNGSWSITGLNLNPFGGANLTLIASDPGAINQSAPVTVPIGNVGCISCVAPVITTQPIDAYLPKSPLPNTALLSVIATGTSLTYQWLRNNIIVPGATNSTLVPTQTGVYKVIIDSACGSITSLEADVVSADAINDTISTFVNVPVVILLSNNDIVCGF